MYLTINQPDLSQLYPIRCGKVYKIPHAKIVKSEKFEAAGVNCRFLGYKGTNFWLLGNEKVIVSSDVEFPLKRAKNFEERDKPTFIEHHGDELDCISVDLAKAYEPEKGFLGIFFRRIGCK